MIVFSINLYFYYNFTCTGLNVTMFGNMVTPNPLVTQDMFSNIGSLHYILSFSLEDNTNRASAMAVDQDLKDHYNIQVIPHCELAL